jgi:hypothetical protein
MSQFRQWLQRGTLHHQSITLLAALLLGISLFQSSASPALAISYSTGLKPGDTASYTLYHKTDTFGSQMKVLSVTGTQVTVNFQDYPSYGVVLGSMWVDIFSGQTNSSVASLFFAVASGLNKGDPIYDGSSISMTDQRSYNCGAGGQMRPQVYAQFPSSGQSVQISWDQSTGIMCNYQANYSNGTIALGFALAGTSLWGSSGSNLDPFVFGQELTGILGLSLLVLVMSVYFRKRRIKVRSRSK